MGEEQSTASDGAVAERFTGIWRNNAWGSQETRSGPGSTVSRTEPVRRKLAEIFRELRIRTLVDAGCGDVNWVSLITSELDLYLGFDVVEEAIAHVRRKFEARKNFFFNTADIAAHVLPRADAILCRDVLGHLDHPRVSSALENFRKSGSRYLISTTFPRGRNDPIGVGHWQPIDLRAAPFSLPEPRFLVSEEMQNSVKSLGVWSLQELA